MPRDPLRHAIVLVTRDYPYGRGEAFVQDEVARLARLGPLVVLPAFNAGGGEPRPLPEGAALDTSLAHRGAASLLRPRVLATLVASAVGELARRPRILWSRRSLVRFVGYLYRAARVLAWAADQRRAGDPPRRVLCFWSNAEAFGMSLVARADPQVVFVARSHRFDVWPEENPDHYLPFRSPIARHTDGLLPCSREGVEFLRRTLPVEPDRVQFGPLGIEPLADPEPWRGRDEILIVSCSTAAAVKRLPLVAASISAAAGGDPHRSWRWAHLGRGQEQIHAALEGRPANLEVELPGWLDRESIYRFLRDRQPNCFVNLSSSEGIPVSIMEALAMRVPVVATAAGGTGELVDDEVGAILPVEVDAEVAAAAIRRVVDAGESMRTAAWERFETAASTDVAVEALRRAVPGFLDPRD